jgi:hypothetical protein
VIGTRLIGESHRARRIQRVLDQALSWKHVVRWAPGSRHAELGGRIVLARPQFQDTFAVKAESVSYVAGTEASPNPLRPPALKAIASMAKRLDQTNRLIGSLDGEMTIYAYEIEQLNPHSPTDTVQILVNQAEQRAIQQELNDLLQERGLMSNEYSLLLAEYSAMPETVMRQRTEVFSYDIRDWTRVCTVSADMSGVRPAQPDMVQHLEGHSLTRDGSNPPYRRFGVVGDPLRYPKSNTTLVENAEVVMQRQMRDWLKRALTEVRADRLARAQRTGGSDVDAAAADFLVAWMLSPRVAPAGLNDFVTQAYGKMDIKWLEVRGY